MPTITPTSKAIQRYYAELADYRGSHVTHELALKTAFQTMLQSLAPTAGWILIPEQTMANGKRPDGTLRDAFNLPRGYWEAKDTGDDLATEIRKKIAAGYPLVNTIFEDTRRAVLYQNKKLAFEADLAKPRELADLLRMFFTHTEPELEDFHTAVDEFKERIPELAQGLIERIQQEHAAANPAFKAAWASFYQLCRASLDPNMRSETVDEMLVQHLLTERLFRTVFHNPDFTRRNVIAAEIEKVIGALTSRAFDRSEFLRSLDRFYVAVESAAKGLDDWSEKQAFLNTVYERFFQGFSAKQADTLGIVYTPQEIVDFMCASVDEVLKREFDASLSTPGVQILDPATGTGNFIVNLIRRISGATLREKYANDLFANEIMLLPYYIASLNIEHAYYERMGEYRAFEGLCFTDTLELAEGRQMALFTEANTERVEREKQAQIMVVIGNPPYNVGQVSENDNNKNRKYPVIDGRVRDTYAKDSTATLSNKLYDAYVKFFRWASDRIGDRDGIVCFVSNNSFVHKDSFDGMRKHLLRDFTEVCHFDFKGNARTSGARRRAEGGNIFSDQIRAGIGITLLVRVRSHVARHVWYHCVDDYWRAEPKRKYLAEVESLVRVQWQPMTIDGNCNWHLGDLPGDFDSFAPMGRKDLKAARVGAADALFRTYSLGVSTNRDKTAYGFDDDALAQQVEEFLEGYNAEVSRWERVGGSTDVDRFVHYDSLKWSRNLKRDLRRGRYAAFDLAAIRPALWCPFTQKWLYCADLVVDEQGMTPRFFPRSADSANKLIVLTLRAG